MVDRLVLNLLKFCDPIALLRYSKAVDAFRLYSYHEYFQNM